jgi:DNA-binding NarL/FixJ family response regulator
LFFERMVEKYPKLFEQPVQALSRGAEMPAYRVVTDAERAEMVRLANEGLSGHAIAEKMGRSQHTVQKWLIVFKAQGLIGDVRAVRPRRVDRVSDAECAKILRMGREGMSSREIAEEMNRSETTVFRLLAAVGARGPRGGSLKGLRHRMVVMARKGLKYSEIAQALGCAVDTVARHLRDQVLPDRTGKPGRPRKFVLQPQRQQAA